MNENHKSHIEELIKVGILDLEDLEINRSGYLSQRQKHRLYFYVSFWLILAGIDMIILALFIYFQLVFQRNFITGIIGSCFIIVPAYMSFANAKPHWEDLQDDKPNTASGKIYKHFTLRSGGTAGKSQIGYCSIGIGDQTFSISPLIYDYIIAEGYYRVYFVSNSRKLLNIEPL